ncbi:MAG: acyltransferase [Pedosphaera sp.]|nr:acyltransferase [Pedosphaera sp.]
MKHSPSIADTAKCQVRPDPEPAARIDLLEGVRGALAFWVMIGHFLEYLGAASLVNAGTGSLLGKAAFVAINGEVPVLLFMIISGFVISHLVEGRRERYGIYIFRRFMRLFPAVTCCFVLGILVNPWQSSVLPGLPWGNDFWLVNQARLAPVHREFAVQNILAHVSMVHGLIPPSLLPEALGAFLGPAWSISTEWQFYLIAPLAIAASKRLSGFALICALVALLQIVFSRLRLGESMENYNAAFIAFYIQYFFIGGLSYFVWRGFHRAVSSGALGPGSPQGMAVGGAAIAFFMLVPALLGITFGGLSLTPFLSIAVLAIWILLFGCLCQITAAPAGIEARIVGKIGCCRVALFLGRISYSVYLVHFPLAVILLRLSKPFWGIPRPAFIALFLIAGSLCTLGAASVLYRYVEAPAIRWARSRSNSE